MQAMDIARTQGEIAALKAQKDPAKLAAAREQLLSQSRNNGQDVTDAAVAQQAYNNAQAEWGTGSNVQKAMQAVTGALTALAGNNLAGALASGASPYLATEIKKLTTGPDGQVNTAANAIAHAVLGAVTAELNNQSAMAGGVGAGGGELAARIITDKLFPGKKPSELSESEKQQVSGLSQLAAGIAGGVASGDISRAVTGGQAGKNAVENNYLSQKQQAQKDKEIAECQTVACKAGVQAKWTAIDLGQDGGFAAGMIAGVPAGLYDTIDSIVKTASNPKETYDALKSLFNSGDVLGNVSDAVKQSYIDRIDRMEAEYQKAGASGSFSAGIEGGKLVTDIAGLLAGGAGVAKGGAVLTEKVVAKVAGKAEAAAVNAGKVPKNPNSSSAITDNEAGGYSYYDQFKNADGGWNWPKNLGFEGNPLKVTIPVGTRLDRYGEPNGSFLAPKGTPYEHRALAPGAKAENTMSMR
nr:VENN motif pre-toxin domain-containing protein [uncultured Erwinia sp.]